MSLPHLAQLLRKVPDPAFEKLRKFVFAELQRWPVRAGVGVGLNSDPDEDVIRKLWPSTADEKKPLGNSSIRSFRHFELFWVYRNTVIHELRTPGYGMKFDSDEEPFYHSMNSIDDDEELANYTIELCYPTSFFMKISFNVIENLKVYFTENELNPYQSYKYGTYWMQELNQ